MHNYQRPLAVIALPALLWLSTCSSEEQTPESTGATTGATGATTEATGATTGATGAASTGATGETLSESPMCQSVAELQASLQGVTGVNLSEDGVDALSQHLDAVKSAVDDLKHSKGEDTVSPDIRAVETAIAEVEAVLQELHEGASVPDVGSDAATAVASLSSAIGASVANAQSQGCQLS